MRMRSVQIIIIIILVKRHQEIITQFGERQTLSTNNIVFQITNFDGTVDSQRILIFAAKATTYFVDFKRPHSQYYYLCAVCCVHKLCAVVITSNHKMVIRHILRISMSIRRMFTSVSFNLHDLGKLLARHFNYLH